jgi:hypothetical protein
MDRILGQFGEIPGNLRKIRVGSRVLYRSEFALPCRVVFCAVDEVSPYEILFPKFLWSQLQLIEEVLGIICRSEDGFAEQL